MVRGSQVCTLPSQALKPSEQVAGAGEEEGAGLCCGGVTWMPHVPSSVILHAGWVEEKERWEACAAAGNSSMPSQAARAGRGF